MTRDHKNTLRTLLTCVQEYLGVEGREYEPSPDIYAWERSLRRILEEVDAANLETVDHIPRPCCVTFAERVKRENVDLRRGMMRAIDSLEFYMKRNPERREPETTAPEFSVLGGGPFTYGVEGK